MRVRLENRTGFVILDQEVVFAGQLPELIRWDGKIFAHRFTSWPAEQTAYRQVPVMDMPAPLPAAVHKCDE